MRSGGQSDGSGLGRAGAYWAPTRQNRHASTTPLMKIHSLIATLFILGTAHAACAADAAANWEEHCAKCHGPDGKGQTKMGKKLNIADLTDAKVQASFTDEAIVTAIKEGVKDKNGKQVMKPIEGFTTDDMKALVPFVRSLKK